MQLRCLTAGSYVSNTFLIPAVVAINVHKLVCLDVTNTLALFVEPRKIARLSINSGHAETASSPFNRANDSRIEIQPSGLFTVDPKALKILPFNIVEPEANLRFAPAHSPDVGSNE